MTEEQPINLRPVGMHDWQFLYDLLAERPQEANISHRAMPSLAEHVGFVRSNPYAAWYIIEQLKHAHYEPVGAVYLTHDNEIGIHISAAHQNRGFARAAIETLLKRHPKPSYKANIAPMNYKSQKLFMDLGFTLKQHTFELKP